MNFWDKLKSFRTLYEKITYPIRKQYHLTQLEYNILMFLYNNPQYNTANDIVKVRKLTKSHVSTSVSSLEKKGLLERNNKPDNKKSILLKLTPASNEIISKGLSAQTVYGDILIRGFTDTEKEQFTELLLKTYKNVDDELTGRQ